MKTRTRGERPDAPGKTDHELVWRPSSGEGSVAALHNLRRAERLKHEWRQMRSESGRDAKAKGPASS